MVGMRIMVMCQWCGSALVIEVDSMMFGLTVFFSFWLHSFSLGMFWFVWSGRCCSCICLPTGNVGFNAYVKEEKKEKNISQIRLYAWHSKYDNMGTHIKKLSLFFSTSESHKWNNKSWKIFKNKRKKKTQHNQQHIRQRISVCAYAKHA